MVKPKDHDEAPPGVNDHPFVPSGKWWSLCKRCGLAEAAHSSSTIDSKVERNKEHIVLYGEVRYAKGEAERKAELERIHQGGRVRIGYYADDTDE